MVLIGQVLIKEEVWEFTLNLAKEAVNLFGFNEFNLIMFRFPDRLLHMRTPELLIIKILMMKKKLKLFKDF